MQHQTKHDLFLDVLAPYDKKIMAMKTIRRPEIYKLPFIGKQFSITFDLLINKISGEAFQSVLHLTMGHDIGRMGDRIPAIWVTNNKELVVVSAISGNMNYYHRFIPGMVENKWMKVEISQKPFLGKVGCFRGFLHLTFLFPSGILKYFSMARGPGRLLTQLQQSMRIYRFILVIHGGQQLMDKLEI